MFNNNENNKQEPINYFAPIDFKAQQEKLAKEVDTKVVEKPTEQFKDSIDKRNIFLLLGCYCNDTRLVKSKDTQTVLADYPEKFHQEVFKAIFNLAQKGSKVITSTEISNEFSPFSNAKEIWNANGVEYIEKAIAETKNKTLNASMYRDNVRKYTIIRNANSNGYDCSFVYDESNNAIMERFHALSSREIWNLINTKFNKFRDSLKDDFGGGAKYKGGDDLDSLLDKYKNQIDIWGIPFENEYLNTVLKGMKMKKFLLFSGSSGSGKSRFALANASNSSVSKMYNWTNKKWIELPFQRPVIFYSSELTKEEIQTILLCHISGIAQDQLEEWSLTEEELIVLMEAKRVLEESPIYIEETPQFSCEIMKNRIESAVSEYGVELVFFDYINECSELLAESKRNTGINLRVDQILYNFGMELKNICNDLNIHLASGTQLSSNYKTEKDANALKSSKALAEKLDGGMIRLPCTLEDLEKLKPILECNFTSNPNMATYVYKNRGGKYKDVIVWSIADLGTSREEGLFVTDNAFNLIEDIKPTKIETEDGCVDFKGIVYKKGITLIDEDNSVNVSDNIEEYKALKVGDTARD